MSLFSPESFVEGGGLLDDVDVLFKQVRVKNWDYNGKVAVPVPALELTMEVEGVEGDHVQYYSIGKNTDWQPSEDGCSIVAVGKATGITSSSNAAIFIKSMVDAGFPANKIEDDVRCFENMKAHMTRIPAPKGRTSSATPREDGKTYEQTVLVVGSIISLPWENKGKTAAKGKPTTAAASGKPTGATQAATTKPAATVTADTGDLDAICTEALLEVLGEKGTLTKAQIPGAVLPKVKDNPLKNKIVARVFSEDFLNNGPWTFEGGKVSM